MMVILLEVANSNERAHGLYERMGFHEHRRRLMSRMILRHVEPGGGNILAKRVAGEGSGVGSRGVGL